MTRNKSFWDKLPKPFFVLAPMANVTDFAFREMIAKYGKPDVMWTEFVSADGLVSNGKEKLLIDIKFSNKQRPIVAQLFSGHPKAMLESAKLVKDMKFDGLDINMGCPDRSVEKQGGGAAHIKDWDNTKKIIEYAKNGAGGLPVSVKTRLGYNKIDIDGWVRFLLEMKLPALTVHLRTRKEMSAVPAHWELMPEIVRLRNEIAPDTLIIGNGDVETIDDAKIKIAKYGCDGIMIGRGIFGKPWLFSNISDFQNRSHLSRKTNLQRSGICDWFVLRESGGGDENITSEQKLKIMLEHAKLFEKTFKGIKNFTIMKKHFKAYVSGWDGAKDLRIELMTANNAKEVSTIVKRYLSL